MTRRILVDYHGLNTATVYFVPSLVERLVGRRMRQREAICTHRPGGGLRWRWYDGSDVGAPTARALTEAYRAAIVARATSPPS